MRIIFGIPSYRRPDKQKTVEYLRSMGYDREDIVISTQTKEDFEAYSRNWGEDAIVIYKDGCCVGDNRNNLLDWGQRNKIKRMVMFDDDVAAVNILSEDSRSNIPLKTREAFQDILERCFITAMNEGCFLWGCAAVDNYFFKTHTIHYKAMITGAMMGISFFGWRFDKRYLVKEDYEASLRVLNKGYNVLRFNMLSAKAGYKTRGGCEEWRKTDADYKCTTMLVSQYPGMVATQKNNMEEVRLIIDKKSRKVLWRPITTIPHDGQPR